MIHNEPAPLSNEKDWQIPLDIEEDDLGDDLSPEDFEESDYKPIELFEAEHHVVEGPFRRGMKRLLSVVRLGR